MARNILTTDFLRIVRSWGDVRVILLVPESSVDFYLREFDYPQMAVEGIRHCPLSKISFLFHFLSWNLLSTRSKKIHKLVQLDRDKSYARYIVTSFLALLGTMRIVRAIFRKFDYWFMPRGGFDYLFRKYQPDLVLATDMQDLRVQELCDTSLIREAKRHGIASVGLGRSWDSMTTKGLLRIMPDRLVVQSFAIRDQVAKYHSIDPRNVVVVGTPHYDKYLTDQRISRTDFFNKIGLDPRKRTILLTLPSDIWTGDSALNQFLLKSFSDWGVQTIVRFPIFGQIDIGGFSPPPFMVFDNPRNADRLEESHLSLNDDERLADLIYHSAMVVTGPSSIVLDAAIFNKPTILIGFDSDNHPRPYYRSVRRYYDYEHQQLVTRAGCLKIAHSFDELSVLANEYLSQPDLGVRERRRIAEGACFKLDGRSGQRLAEVIWNTLTQKN